jgi:site-specific DNA-methyltransferase (adenine-specific)
MKNTLYYGDNLDILRNHIKDESIDLIYLDPPFNSKASYNILFKEPSGKPSEAQITAFDDTWHWTSETEKTFSEIVKSAPAQVIEMMRSFRQFIGMNDMMAYLTMMCIRLLELRRVLKETGSIYLHCDPTASHYLKILMDSIFGKNNFRNEITWKRKTGRGETQHKSNKFGVCTDIVLFYSKTQNNFFEAQFNYQAAGYQNYVDKFFTYKDENGRRYCIDNLASPSPRPNLMYEYKGYKPPKNGWAISKEKMEQWDKEGRLHYPESKEGRIRRKRYLDELKGKPVQNLWDDIEMISSQAAERLGYPTQKPEALLDRIINTSSREGDLILDPFCGCGTTISVAQRMNRRWIGIDITHLAINLIKWRLKDMFALEPRKDYMVVGEPEDHAGARDLFALNRYQFQWWATSLINAKPYGEKKKGADTGIDGHLFFSDEEGQYKKAVVQVKGGKVEVSDIRDLGHVIEREKSEIGIFITLEPPTRQMSKEALEKGYYHSDFLNKDYLRLQILTIEELLRGKQPDIPSVSSFIKKAPIVNMSPTQELDL